MVASVGRQYLFIVVGQAAAVLMGRYYYVQGGNSEWMATIVQTAGFPILFIPLFLLHPSQKLETSASPSIKVVALIYVVLGLLVAGDNMLYSVGLLYLSASTYSLICSTQLAFNAVFSYFLNSQKMTALILNSVGILVVGRSDCDLHVARGDLCFDRGSVCEREWKGLQQEMDGFDSGRVSYVLTLVWTAVSWQVCAIGVVGLIFTVSSLFSNIISTVSLVTTPLAALIVFHDKMSAVKVIAILMALCGFCSYIYQNYLDDANERNMGSHSHTDDIEEPHHVQ
ncbi:putative purine permease 11 [Hibiscus syriacus]|uniref:Purine permease 11 n=1 Tax=Hibiscus syriacus TaxID=106335 RepID=A0A6A3C2C3_HIBSY|nr:putative purine permease 11 [Hibiscus syriacus]